MNTLLRANTSQPVSLYLSQPILLRLLQHLQKLNFSLLSHILSTIWPQSLFFSTIHYVTFEFDFFNVSPPKESIFIQTSGEPSVNKIDLLALTLVRPLQHKPLLYVLRTDFTCSHCSSKLNILNKASFGQISKKMFRSFKLSYFLKDGNKFDFIKTNGKKLFGKNLGG